MAVVKKKKRSLSLSELQVSLTRLIELLELQDEVEAVADLQSALNTIEDVSSDSAAVDKALATILDAFTGVHELEAYTIRRGTDGQGWSAADDLYIASTTVWSLTKRLYRTP